VFATVELLCFFEESYCLDLFLFLVFLH
jgi:hypothetical protein